MYKHLYWGLCFNSYAQAGSVQGMDFTLVTNLAPPSSYLDKIVTHSHLRLSVPLAIKIGSWNNRKLGDNMGLDNRLKAYVENLHVKKIDIFIENNLFQRLF